MSKGSRSRISDKKKFDDNYENIFTKRNQVAEQNQKSNFVSKEAVSQRMVDHTNFWEEETTKTNKSNFFIKLVNFFKKLF